MYKCLLLVESMNNYKSHLVFFDNIQVKKYAFEKELVL